MNRGELWERETRLYDIILNYGISDFIAIKICVTVVLLFVPFLVLDETDYWTINGYLVSFIVAGTLGTALNIQAMRNERLLLSPEQAIFLFLILVLVLTSTGEEIDKRTYSRIRPYVDCLLNDIAIILVSIIDIFKKKE